jgi:holliday junction DNA helicase RuvA
MIGMLRGQLVHVGPEEVLIDVGGVGYRVAMAPASALELSGHVGEVVIWVHTQLRSDALQLHGFCSREDRDAFEVLLTTPGVGPALALSILGAMGATGVASALAAQDATAFEAVSGVGKKTAARLLLELKGKFEAFGLEGTAAPSTLAGGETHAEVAAALSGLGYSSEEVRRALGVLEGTESVEEALRRSLRELSPR